RPGPRGRRDPRLSRRGVHRRGAAREAAGEDRADRARVQPLRADAGDLRHEYLPIAEHGLVGDLHTVALVGTTGTIDWYCCLAFDSPSVFGCVVDADDGGSYAI